MHHYDSGNPVDTEVYSYYDLTGCTEPTDGVLKVEKSPRPCARTAGRR